jgi:hypothetical protein
VTAVAVVATLSAAIAIYAKRTSFEPDRLSQARTLARTIQTAATMCSPAAFTYDPEESR